MAVNLAQSERTEGIWYQYDEDVRLKIRHTSLVFLTELRKKFTTMQKKGNQVIEFMTDVQKQQHADAIYDHMLEDWEGIVDGSPPEPVPCTLVNKKRLLDGYVLINQFVNEKALESSPEQEAVEEDIKNSDGS